ARSPRRWRYFGARTLNAGLGPRRGDPALLQRTTLPSRPRRRSCSSLFLRLQTNWQQISAPGRRLGEISTDFSASTIASNLSSTILLPAFLSNSPRRAGGRSHL